MSNSFGGLTGLHPYGIAAQVNQDTSFTLPDTTLTDNFKPSNLGTGFTTNGVPREDMGPPSMAADNNFDILNFLMDEESGLGGTNTWDATDIPADFSLWS